MQKKCKSCQKEYTPKKQAQPRCEPCILQAEKDKKFKQLKKQIEKPLKPPKQIKVQPDTQAIALSEAIKKRDAGLPCISCGKTMQPYEIQAGHYIARGKSIKLKYEHETFTHSVGTVIITTKNNKKCKKGLEKV